MTTEVFNVTGIAYYPKVFESNRDMHEGFYGERDGAYTIDVELDKENLDIVSKSGSRVEPRITDEGLQIKFKRKHKHMIAALGGAPKVVDHEDKPWDESKFIGNGSKVEVWFEVYDTKMGKGTRLLGVRVLDLVEYVSDNDGEEPKAKLPF